MISAASLSFIEVMMVCSVSMSRYAKTSAAIVFGSIRNILILSSFGNSSITAATSASFHSMSSERSLVYCLESINSRISSIEFSADMVTSSWFLRFFTDINNPSADDAPLTGSAIAYILPASPHMIFKKEKRMICSVCRLILYMHKHTEVST